MTNIINKFNDWQGPNQDIYKVTDVPSLGTHYMRLEWKGSEFATSVGTDLVANLLNNLSKNSQVFTPAIATRSSGSILLEAQVTSELGPYEGMNLRILVPELPANTNPNDQIELSLLGSSSKYLVKVIHQGNLVAKLASELSAHQILDLVLVGNVMQEITTKPSIFHGTNNPSSMNLVATNDHSDQPLATHYYDDGNLVGKLSYRKSDTKMITSNSSAQFTLLDDRDKQLILDQVSDDLSHAKTDLQTKIDDRVKYTDVASETRAGIITEARIRAIAPQPNLTPYVRYDQGYRVTDNSTRFVRTNGIDTWTSLLIDMFDAAGNYTGSYHTNGGRAYYKVPNRNGGNWNEIMDQWDRDYLQNQINNLNNRMSNAELDMVRDIRLAGYRSEVVWERNEGGTELQGYVVTSITNWNTDGVIDTITRRCLQFWTNRRGWVTVPLA